MEGVFKSFWGHLEVILGTFRGHFEGHLVGIDLAYLVILSIAKDLALLLSNLTTRSQICAKNLREICVITA